MNIPQVYSDVRWWKSYVIYLVMVLPLLVIDYLFIPGGTWVHAGILIPVIVAGSLAKDPIQRKVWP